MAQSPAGVNILSNNVGLKTDNTQYALVLCGTPITSGVDSFGAINFKEFAN